MTANIYIPKSKEDWKSKRDSFIGGSEIATILGLNDYQTPYQLWCVKTGKEPPFEGNEHTERGKIFEPAVVEYFKKKTNSRVIEISQDDIIYLHPDIPHIGGTPDRFFFPENSEEKQILEAKTTLITIEDKDISVSWFLQLQFYLGITGLKNGSIAWIASNYNFDYLPISFDKQTFDSSVSAADEFWKENVQKDIPPDPQNWKDISKQFKQSISGVFIESTQELYEKHLSLLSVKGKIKELEQEKEDLENDIKMGYTDNEGLTFDGVKLSTWKSTKPIKKFDKDRFSKENPELYKKYMIEAEGHRRFLLKIK